MADANLINHPNPYIIGTAIDERERFFGRESLFHFLEDNLRQNVKVILLHGQRRIGKSSVLKQISNFVAKEEFVFVTFDLQDKSYLLLSELLHQLAIEIVYHLNLELDKITPPTVEDLGYNPDYFSSRFLPQIYQELDKKHLVLLFDEFDVLSGNPDVVSQGSGFFRYLRSLVNKQKKLHIIPVVGRNINDMQTLLGLFKSAPTLEIGFLDEVSVKRLIRNPCERVLTYEDDAINAILELSAGHPYFTQVICFTLFGRAREQQNWRVTRQDVKSIVDKAIENAQGGLAWFWDGLPCLEQVVFSAVAEAQKIALCNAQRVPEDPLKLLESYGVLQTEPLIEAAQQLDEKGFLDKTGRGLKVELVRRWLVQLHPLRQEIWELEQLKKEDIDRFCESAIGLHQQGQKQEALATYKQVLALNPNHFSTVFALAEGYLEAEEFSQAIEFYTRACKVDPSRYQEGLLRAIETYGHALITQRDFKKAKEQFNQVLSIEPDRSSARQRLREIEVYERQGSSWICRGYRDKPHPDKWVERNQACPICQRIMNSSELRVQSYLKKSLLVGMLGLVGIIALITAGGFGVYRLSTPCLDGEKKVFGIRCVTDLDRNVSRGERTFFPSSGNPNIDHGVEAFRKKNYTEAAEFFQKAVAANRRDPEALIYYNNALAKQKGFPLTLAVVVPTDKAKDIAQEMLRGVAQAQNQFNKEGKGGFNGRLLEIAIANDSNSPDKAKKVAQELIKDKSVLGVIGHFKSDSSEAALAEYEKNDLAMISPTNTSTLLKSKVFFRTTTSDVAAGKKLAEYAKNVQRINKVVIFYNHHSIYSNSLREAFIKNFENLGGNVAQSIDLSNPNFRAELEVPRSLYKNDAGAVLLFPNTDYVSVAREIAHEFFKVNVNLKRRSINSNRQELKLLGGDSLYSEETLKAGGKEVEGLVLAVPWFDQAPGAQDFAKAATKRWGGQVSWRTANSYDATQAFITALSNISNPSRLTVLQMLRRVDIPANQTSGTALQFTDNGECKEKPVLVRIKGGKFEIEKEN